MKKAFWKRLSATLLTLLLLATGSARAGIIGLDPVLSGWLDQESTIRFSMSVKLQTLLPFTDEQATMINDVLKHLSVLAAIEQDGGDSLSTLAFACDGDRLFTLTERESGGAFSLATTLLPNRVLESQRQSVIEQLSGASQEDESSPSFDMAAAISEARDYYPALISACEPFAEKKKANYKIKDIGTAKWSQIARLTTEQSDEMLPLLRAMLQCGMDPAHRAELEEARFDKNFIVALYQLGENGDDMAVYMKGNLLFPDKTVGKLSYQWAFMAKGGERKDAYQYELSRNTRPASSRVVAASLSQSLSDDQMSLKANTVLTTKANRITTAQTQKTDLSGKANSSTRTLKGSISDQVKVIVEGKTSTALSTLTPDLTLTRDNSGAVLSGTLEANSQKEKAVTSSITFTFAKDVPADFTSSTESQGLYTVVSSGDAEEDSSEPLSSILQNVEEDPEVDSPEDGSVPSDAASQSDAFLVSKPPVGMESYAIPQSPASISLDRASEAQRASLMDELSQNLAGKLLLALMELPEEDLALLQNGMTPEDYASFLSLLGNP